jgi:hypothetical protein
MKLDQITDASFWNKVPAAYLQPLIDAVVPYEDLGFGYTMNVLGDPHDPEAPAAVVWKAPAGYVLARHSHGCHRYEVIIQGSITNEFGDVLGVGGVMAARPDEMYGPIVAGPEGYTSVEVFSRLEGTYLITWDEPGGPRLDNRLDFRPKAG